MGNNQWTPINDALETLKKNPNSAIVFINGRYVLVDVTTGKYELLEIYQ